MIPSIDVAVITVQNALAATSQGATTDLNPATLSAISIVVALIGLFFSKIRERAEAATKKGNTPGAAGSLLWPARFFTAGTVMVVVACSPLVPFAYARLGRGAQDVLYSLVLAMYVALLVLTAWSCSVVWSLRAERDRQEAVQRDSQEALAARSGQLGG